LLMLFPGAGVLAIVLWIGAVVTAIGVLEIIAGIRLQGRRPRGTPASA
jgi:uncharacterized membrane protein HdeD (DUF308 family)